MGRGGQELQSSVPGLGPPSLRDHPLKSGPLWLAGRRRDDAAEGLWRVHDGLYDFSGWVRSHPGGSDWLRMTKGTDITEAFEAHHIQQTAERLLPHFFVRAARGPRRSPFTFREDGFYRTLKRRAREALRRQPAGPTRHSALTADLLLAAALLAAAAAGRLASWALGALAGVLLALVVVCAHNFFHQKDNFRMYYFDLSLMSSRHWRISHALSHHLFPNTLLDLEISMFEPVLQHLPRPKGALARFGPWLWSPLVYAAMFPAQLALRLILYAKRVEEGPRREDLLPLLFPLAIYTYGGCGVGQALLTWLWVISVSSFTFGLIGLNAAHHHPDIFHDGDAPRADLDWGKLQLDAVQDRPWVSRSSFLALVTFGNHGLHHLFPTLDHGRLEPLLPALERTCREFGVPYRANSVLGLLAGQFRQCARVAPNPLPPGGKAQ